MRERKNPLPEMDGPFPATGFSVKATTETNDDSCRNGQNIPMGKRCFDVDCIGVIRFSLLVKELATVLLQKEVLFVLKPLQNKLETKSIKSPPRTRTWNDRTKTCCVAITPGGKPFEPLWAATGIRRILDDVPPRCKTGRRQIATTDRHHFLGKQPCQRFSFHHFAGLIQVIVDNRIWMNAKGVIDRGQ